MADPAPSPDASRTDDASLPDTAAPAAGAPAPARLPDAEAALRNAGLKRFRLIRPARAAQPPPSQPLGATTVLPPQVAAAALATPVEREPDPTPTVVLPPRVAPSAGAATTSHSDAAHSPVPPQPAPGTVVDASVLADWVAQLGRMTRDLHAACVVHVHAAGDVADIVASWPAAEVDAAAALAFARRALDAKKYLVEPAAADPGLRVIALPLVLAGLPRHALVARIPRPANASVSADLKPLLQASAWLKPLLAARAPQAAALVQASTLAAEPVLEQAAVHDAVAGQRATSATGLRDALDLLAVTLEHRELVPAATALVNRLAAQLRAGRVSLGLL